MSSDNETVTDIVAERRGPYYKMGRSNATLDMTRRKLAPFLDGALAQSPDGGAAYYEHENPFLHDCSTWADDLARMAYGR